MSILRDFLIVILSVICLMTALELLEPVIDNFLKSMEEFDDDD